MLDSAANESTESEEVSETFFLLSPETEEEANVDDDELFFKPLTPFSVPSTSFSTFVFSTIDSGNDVVSPPLDLHCCPIILLCSK